LPIASAIFIDLDALEAKPETKDSDLVEAILAAQERGHTTITKTSRRSWITAARIGLQHDPLVYGAYNLNPFLVSVEMVPMRLVVNQGEVAVLKAYVGLATEDTSGAGFQIRLRSRSRPSRDLAGAVAYRQICHQSRCYSAEIVPTFILTLKLGRSIVDGAQSCTKA